MFSNLALVFSNMSGTKKESHWIPLADLMTVLMIIFLFMAIVE